MSEGPGSLLQRPSYSQGSQVALLIPPSPRLGRHRPSNQVFVTLRLQRGPLDSNQVLLGNL